MKSKYYTPSIHEFKQGFKFERCLHKKGDHIGGVFFMNSDLPSKEFYAEKDKWVEEVVWWDREPSKEPKEAKFEDTTIYYMESHLDLMPNYSLETLLKDGRIREKK